MRDKILKLAGDIIKGSGSEISSLQVSDVGDVILVVDVDPSRGPDLEKMRQEIERKIGMVNGVGKSSVVLTAEKKREPKTADIDPHKMAKNPILNIPAKHVIVVASGKGGVGKSTVAANIAVYIANIAQMGSGEIIGQGGNLRVGLLDADIYGPSQPLMMGDEEYKPELNEQKQLVPLQKHGLKIMSIGFMTDKSKALIWRGPMAQNAFYQMLRDVAWAGDDGEPLDYLIIDMPPGTGDVQLTLAQKVKVSGAVIVSTPQDVALIDARRAVEMFSKTGIDVLGLVENMSTHICSNCGHEDHIFAHGGAAQEADELGVRFLGDVPLSKNIRLNSDGGTPIVLAEPESEQAKAFGSIADNIIAALN